MIHKPKRQLNLFDAVCIIVGVIVGAGVYETSPIVAANSGSVWAALAVWLFGGATALIAALCYAELSTSFPRSGGDYVYLSEGYNRDVGNLFAWCEFWIIRPGNIGMMAYVFAGYIGKIWPLGWQAGGASLDSIAYAGGSVVVLTILNLAGVRSGKTTQNILTVLKSGGLFGLSLLLLAFARNPASPLTGSEPQAVGETSFGQLKFAILMAMFAYGGWADMVNVAAEVREPRRNLFRALVLGAIAVALIYVTANLAFFHALGYEGVANSNAVAVDAINQLMSRNGGAVVSVLVGVSCLGAVNAMLMTGSRIIYAAGEANPTLRVFGVWSHRFDAPVMALLTQSLTTLILIVALGLTDNGFEQLMIFTSPVYWLFALLVAFSLFRLRRRTPDEANPYRVPLYPITPLLFMALCAFMLYSGVTYAYANRNYAAAALASLCVVAVGFVFVWLTRSKEA